MPLKKGATDSAAPFLFSEISGTWIFRPGKAVEEPGGGVAALRRTTGTEDLRRQGGKVAFQGIHHAAH